MEIVNTLRDAAVKVLAQPEVIAALEKQGAAPSGNTPEEFAAEIKQQFDWAAGIAKQQGITMEQ